MKRALLMPGNAATHLNVRLLTAHLGWQVGGFVRESAAVDLKASLETLTAAIAIGDRESCQTPLGPIAVPSKAIVQVSACGPILLKNSAEDLFEQFTRNSRKFVPCKINSLEPAPVAKNLFKRHKIVVLGVFQQNRADCCPAAFSFLLAKADGSVRERGSQYHLATVLDSALQLGAPNECIESDRFRCV